MSILCTDVSLLLTMSHLTSQSTQYWPLMSKPMLSCAKMSGPLITLWIGRLPSVHFLPILTCQQVHPFFRNFHGSEHSDGCKNLDSSLVIATFLTSHHDVQPLLLICYVILKYPLTNGALLAAWFWNEIKDKRSWSMTNFYMINVLKDISGLTEVYK